jgi:hypothetical protein
MSISQYPPVSGGGIPTGTTTTRPSAPDIGDVFYNGLTTELEIYTVAGWVPASKNYNKQYNYVPEAPTIGTATYSGTTTAVSLTWSLNGDGGNNLTSIVITPYLNGTTAQTPITAATTTATSASITGLSQGSSYTFTVKAVNSVGGSAESKQSNSVTLPTLITVDYLVIAGGSGGYRSGAEVIYYAGGGGGAGGYRTSAGTSGGNSAAESSKTLSISTNYTVTVGAGGSQANGSNSIFSDITSIGGGRGATYNATGSNGGSGGGGGGNGGGGTKAGGTGTANQGFDGGTAGNGFNEGAGGGGAGGQGAQGGSNIGGNGGAGIASSITGSSVTRAGGGGGGGANGANGGTGGSGGGGAGGKGGTIDGVDGSANTGSGGGGYGIKVWVVLVLLFFAIQIIEQLHLVLDLLAQKALQAADIKEQQLLLVQGM